MLLKRCEYCDIVIESKRREKFCSNFCQSRHYYRRPEIREKYRLRAIEYRRTHPEWREKHRITAVTKYREKRAEYWKKYLSRPKVRARINERRRLKRNTDISFLIADRIRRSLNHALTNYSKTGKVMSSKKYGLDFNKIIEKLKPFPQDIRKFEIDHIIPLSKFDLNNPENVGKAFAPSNLQWLSMEDNRRKSNKIAIELQKIL